jgi:hypothetical protein
MAARSGGIAGVAPKRAPRHRFERSFLRHVVVDMKNSTRDSGRQLEWPWRRAPKGGGTANSGEEEHRYYGPKRKEKQRGEATAVEIDDGRVPSLGGTLRKKTTCGSV